MQRRFVKTLTLAALVVAACCGAAWALGEETFGNAPLSAENYKDWPGVEPVVNHTSRVYHQWVNGNEQFFYRGDPAALNDTLQKFAGVQVEARNVVLRPGPGLAHTFQADKTVAYGWRLHLIGGIARHLTTLDRGDQVWSKNPTLSIYAGGDVDLAKLEIPKAVTLLTLTELKQRARLALKSTDKTVRGWTCGQLAELDPYDDTDRDAIAGMLKDPDNWVRLNAASCLPEFGKKAMPVVPMLKAALATDDAQLKETAQKSIETIEKAEDRAAAENAHREMLPRIEAFVAARKKLQ